VNTRLLIISGPIASGKSSVAQRLAADFRAAGRSAAVLDLDRMYMMLDDSAIMSSPAIGRQARRAAAALVDHYVLESINLVIVEGEFWTLAQRQEFVGHLTTPVAPAVVTLHVAVEEAQQRVATATDGRRLSRIPAVLRQSHADFARAPAIDGDITIETRRLSVAEVAALVSSALERLVPGHLDEDRVPPLFRDVDCIQVPLPDLEAGLAFYRDALGHALIWRTDTAAGLRLADTPTELVIQTERPELEPNLSVMSADAAAQRFVAAGGAVLAPAFDIAIGRCAVLQDPWGNRLLVLDHSRGRLLTDATGRVRTGTDGALQTQARS
jgi:lactoylglutathione lyase